jgi:hypothetical protein
MRRTVAIAMGAAIINVMVTNNPGLDTGQNRQSASAIAILKE